MVAVFLDATTADGYNPYRISRSGIDWEVPEPSNPWANIGYWSDHQVIYLVKLLEASRRFHPGRLEALVDRAVFTHADVPYRIAHVRRDGRRADRDDRVRHRGGSACRAARRDRGRGRAAGARARR